MRERIILLPRAGCRLLRWLYGLVLLLPIKCIEHVRRVELPEHRAVGDDAVVVIYERHAIDTTCGVRPKYGIDTLLPQMPAEGIFRP